MSTTPRYIPKALLRPRVKPFLIWAAPPFIAFAALGSAAFATLVALDGQLNAITIVNHPVSRASYLALVYPSLLIGAAIELAAAYGLLMEQPFARSLLTRWSAVWLIAHLIISSSLTGLGPIALLLESGWNPILLALSFWYFYGYARVREYYAHLERRQLST